MSEVVIKAKDIGKSYLIGHQSKERYLALRDVIVNKATGWWSKIRNPQCHIHEDIEEFWALKDISFEVKKGEMVGIIGRNGAGKSTLLKILSRITEPTTGEVSIKGRVASLLEVGTGFHPELTGRENIFLNGAILGMNRQEIKRKFDEIVDFAEIEKFLDTPVKRYSSGMYVRLAFAVAAHLEPEILVVDEVLSVGDIQFQKKCIGKMGEVAKGGRTILFVSHNMPAVNNLCSKAILLEKGRIALAGDTSTVVNAYSERMNNADEPKRHLSRTDGVQFIAGRLTNLSGKVISGATLDEPFFIEMTFRVGDDVKGIPVPNCHVKNADGIYAFVVSAPDIKRLEPGLYTSVCKVPGNLLNDGAYTVGLAVTEFSKSSFKVHFFEEHYLTITIVDRILDNPHRYNYGGPIPGLFRPILEWDLKKTGEK